jgi:two-component system KDP operon response regulator KdpE
VSAAPQKVLVVDDEPPIRKLLRLGLGTQGYEILEAANARTALELIAQKPDLVILDLGLPDMQGLDVLASIRARLDSVPIVVLSSRDDEAGKVAALDRGADDYVTKPFGFMELMARVEALLRRASGQTGRAESFTFGDVSVDFKKGEVRRKGKQVEMSAREMRLLQYFVEHRGEVIARDRLLDEVWGYDEAPLTRTVDMHVAKLRKKIESRPADPQFLLTVHGMGYKFNG